MQDIKENHVLDFEFNKVIKNQINISFLLTHNWIALQIMEFSIQK